VDMQLTDLLTVGGLALVVTIVVQLAKGFVAERFVPLFAVSAGIAVGVLVTYALGLLSVETVAQAILTGILAGAAAIGIYEVAPRSVLKPKDD